MYWKCIAFSTSALMMRTRSLSWCPSSERKRKFNWFLLVPDEEWTVLVKYVSVLNNLVNVSFVCILNWGNCPPLTLKIITGELQCCVGDMNTGGRSCNIDCSECSLRHFWSGIVCAVGMQIEMDTAVHPGFPCKRCESTCERLQV